MATLDAYYLAVERAYCHLYRQAATQPNTEWGLQTPNIALVAGGKLGLWGLRCVRVLWS